MRSLRQEGQEEGEHERAQLGCFTFCWLYSKDWLESMDSLDTIHGLTDSQDSMDPVISLDSIDPLVSMVSKPWIPRIPKDRRMDAIGGTQFE